VNFYKYILKFTGTWQSYCKWRIYNVLPR